MCLGLATVNAAERRDSSGADPKHRVSSGENRGDKALKKRTSKSSHGRSQTKHRSSNAASRVGKSTHRASNSNKTSSAKSKVKGNRRDVPYESEVSAIADEANNRVELPRHENENVNEIGIEAENDDQSTILLGAAPVNDDGERPEPGR